MRHATMTILGSEALGGGVHGAARGGVALGLSFYFSHPMPLFFQDLFWDELTSTSHHGAAAALHRPCTRYWAEIGMEVRAPSLPKFVSGSETCDAWHHLEEQ